MSSDMAACSREGDFRFELVGYVSSEEEWYCIERPEIEIAI